MKPPVRLHNVANVLIALGLAGLLLLAGGCAERAQEPVEPSAAIALQVTGTWSSAYEAAEPDALAALYAEDASLYRSYGPTIRGRGAIHDHLAAELSAGNALNLQVSDAHGEGNVLFVQGEYAVMRPDGSEFARGDFVQLWTRDGAAWQLVNDAWHERGVRLGERSGYELAERLFAEWTRQVRSGDGSALVDLYAEDALVVVEGREPLQGRESVRELWSDGGTADAVHWDIDEVHAEGRLAFVTGLFRYDDSDTDVDAGLETELRAGAFLQLWVRSEDEWRVYRETWPHGVPVDGQ